MAGYNATFEALAAGLRPILVPRRYPRIEQALRADRLAALGLADIVSTDGAAQVCDLLRGSRVLPVGVLEAVGINVDGADRAAARLVSRKAVGAADIAAGR